VIDEPEAFALGSAAAGLSPAFVGGLIVEIVFVSPVSVILPLPKSIAKRYMKRILKCLGDF
jgi:hypothetical protein